MIHLIYKLLHKLRGKHTGAAVISEHPLVMWCPHCKRAWGNPFDDLKWPNPPRPKKRDRHESSVDF